MPARHVVAALRLVFRFCMTAFPENTSPQTWGSRAAAGQTATGTAPELVPSSAGLGSHPSVKRTWTSSLSRGEGVAPALRRPLRFPVAQFSRRAGGTCRRWFVRVPSAEAAGARLTCCPICFCRFGVPGGPLPARDSGMRASLGVPGAGLCVSREPLGPSHSHPFVLGHRRLYLQPRASFRGTPPLQLHEVSIQRPRCWGRCPLGQRWQWRVARAREVSPDCTAPGASPRIASGLPAEAAQSFLSLIS